MNDEILNIIYDALDIINREKTTNEDCPKTKDTVLFGRNSFLDSIEFVNLIVVLEEKIDTKLGHRVALVNEEVFSGEASPFRTVETLSHHIAELVRPQK